MENVETSACMWKWKSWKVYILTNEKKNPLKKKLIKGKKLYIYQMGNSCRPWAVHRFTC